MLNSRWSKGIVAVAVVVAALGMTSTVASAADGGPALEAGPLLGTPVVMRSWPHGTCVDSGGGDAYSLDCNGGAYQQWPAYAVPVGDNGRHLVDAATGRCLDSDREGSVYTNPCQDYNSYQAWTIESFNRPEDGRLVTRYKNVSTGKWLAIGYREQPASLDVYATSDESSAERDFAQS